MKFESFYLKLFALLFAYSLLIGLFVQLVLLPHLLPNLHAGNGLLVGNDSIKVHEQAITYADSLKGGGKILAIRPGKLMYHLVGIIYWLTYPIPAVVLPFQAFVHSLAATLLYFLFYTICQSRRVAFVAICPYFFSLSALNMYTQLLKDALDCAGLYLFLVSWCVLLIRLPKGVQRYFCLAGVAFGHFICSYNKPYLMPLFWLFSVVAAIFFWDKAVNKESGKVKAGYILALLLLSFGLKVLGPNFSSPARTEVAEMDTGIIESTGKGWTWSPSTVLPSKLDGVFEMLGRVRRGYIYEAFRGATSLDADVQFSSSKDVIAYVPRAIQIMLLSPFPNQWFSSGSHVTSKTFRLVGAFEELLFYLGLIGFLLFIVNCNPSRNFWILILFAFTTMLLQSLTIINVGTLTRHRFAYQSLINGFGILGYYFVCMKRKEKDVLVVT